MSLQLHMGNIGDLKGDEHLKPDPASTPNFSTYGAVRELKGKETVRNTSPWVRLRENAWLWLLVHCEFWISATFVLLQAYFPGMVSDATVRRM